MINSSRDTLDIISRISSSVRTFHHHFHVLYDIAKTYEGTINYVEIGCYAGASACLMAQRPNTNIYSIDLGTPISPSHAQANVLRHNIHGNKFE